MPLYRINQKDGIGWFRTEGPEAARIAEEQAANGWARPAFLSERIWYTAFSERMSYAHFLTFATLVALFIYFDLPAWVVIIATAGAYFGVEAVKKLTQP